MVFQKHWNIFYIHCWFYSFASYTILGVRHSLSRGDLFRTWQLHPQYSLPEFKICLLHNKITDSIFLIQQLLTLTILQLKMLCIGCRFGKWCYKSFRNILSIVFTFMEKGGLNHNILHLHFSFSILSCPCCCVGLYSQDMLCIYCVLKHPCNS